MNSCDSSAVEDDVGDDHSQHKPRRLRGRPQGGGKDDDFSHKWKEGDEEEDEDEDEEEDEDGQQCQAGLDQLADELKAAVQGGRCCVTMPSCLSRPAALPSSFRPPVALLTAVIRSDGHVRLLLRVSSAGRFAAAVRLFSVSLFSTITASFRRASRRQMLRSHRIRASTFRSPIFTSTILVSCPHELCIHLFEDYESLEIMQVAVENDRCICPKATSSRSSNARTGVRSPSIGSSGT